MFDIMGFLAKNTAHQGAPKSSRLILIIIVGACVIIAAGIYWFFSQSSQVSNTRDEQPQTAKELPLKRVNWKKNLYEDETFQSLKNPLPAPLEAGVTGNTNPFGEKPRNK